MIILKHSLRIENNVTNIDIKVNENVNVKSSNHFKSRSRRNDYSRYIKIEFLITKLNFFLNYSLLYY